MGKEATQELAHSSANGSDTTLSGTANGSAVQNLGDDPSQSGQPGLDKETLRDMLLE